MVGEVRGFLESDAVPYAVIGGLALHAYGLTRSTQDLDFVVPLTVQDRLVAWLESQGYETLHRSDGYSNHLHSDSARGRLDFVYVTGATERELFEGCALRLDLGEQTLPVPRAEHIVAMKVQAMKNDPSRTHQELADIGHLMRLDRVDRGEIRGYFARAGLEERFRELEDLG